MKLNLLIHYKTYNLIALSKRFSEKIRRTGKENCREGINLPLQYFMLQEERSPVWEAKNPVPQRWISAVFANRQSISNGRAPMSAP